MINGSLCNTGERQEKQEETANGYKVSFCDDDVAAILSIPIGSGSNSDALQWHFEQKGVYTVKSG